MNRACAMVRKYEKAAILVLLAALVAGGLHYRLLFAEKVHYTGFHEDTGYTHDEYHYNLMAQNIVENRVYGYMTPGESDAYVTPGFPVFLAGVYSVAGFGEPGILAAKRVQAVLSALSILLVFLIGRRISGKRAGLLAAALAAFYPPLIWYSRFLLTETLYIFMFLCYFLVQLRAMEETGWGWHFAAGLLGAAAVLVRPPIFVLLPLAYLLKYLSSRDGRRGALGQFGIFLLGFVLLMSPWWIRNLVTMGKFILLCTQSNPFYYGIIEDYAQLPPANNEAADGIRLILRYLKTQPLTTIKWYTVRKLGIIFAEQDFWLPGGLGYLSSLKLLHPFIMVTGVIGAGMAVFRREIRYCALFLALNVGFQLLFIPVPRYAVPLAPLLCVCGAHMLGYLWRQLRGEKRAKILSQPEAEQMLSRK